MGKLEKLIFRYLHTELSDKIFYPCGGDIWILDFYNKNWCVQYNSNGFLNYNPKYFDTFFRIFSLNQPEYQKTLKKWFETYTGYRVNHISRRNLDTSYYIDGIRNIEGKKWSILERYGHKYGVISKYLKIKDNTFEEEIRFGNFLRKNEIY